MGRRARVAGAVLPLCLLAGCQGEDERPGSASDPATPGPTCVTSGTDAASLQVTVPAGFARGSEGNLLDQVWGRPPADGEGLSDVVALDAFERDSPDAYVVQRAMAAVGSSGTSDSGRPAYDRAVRRVERDDLEEISWTSPDRDGGGEHTGFVTLVTVDDVRFTVSIVAAAGDAFETLKDQVVPSIEEGDCSG